MYLHQRDSAAVAKALRVGGQTEGQYLINGSDCDVEVVSAVWFLTATALDFALKPAAVKPRLEFLWFAVVASPSLHTTCLARQSPYLLGADLALSLPEQ